MFEIFLFHLLWVEMLSLLFVRMLYEEISDGSTYFWWILLYVLRAIGGHHYCFLPENNVLARHSTVHIAVAAIEHKSQFLDFWRRVNFSSGQAIESIICEVTACVSSLFSWLTSSSSESCPFRSWMGESIKDYSAIKELLKCWLSLTRK